ncbi:POK8 protein, partial [Chroicocephalus maculipennis]|nr:POK8 protein [Chroicocephalus maculipennis]
EIVVMDLKDWFFTIPLAEEDKEKFSVTVPSVNNVEPTKRYQWKVLPQSIKNLPTICQWFVAKALSPVCALFPSDCCYHYMDDILLAAATPQELEKMEQKTR